MRQRRRGFGQPEPDDLALRPPAAGAHKQERGRSASESHRHANTGPRPQRRDAAINAQRKERWLYLGRKHLLARRTRKPRAAYRRACPRALARRRSIGMGVPECPTAIGRGVRDDFVFQGRSRDDIDQMRSWRVPAGRLPTPAIARGSLYAADAHRHAIQRGLHVNPRRFALRERPAADRKSTLKAYRNRMAWVERRERRVWRDGCGTRRPVAG